MKESDSLWKQSGENVNQKVDPKLEYSNTCFAWELLPFTQGGKPKGSLSYYKPINHWPCLHNKGCSCGYHILVVQGFHVQISLQTKLHFVPILLHFFCLIKSPNAKHVGETDKEAKKNPINLSNKWRLWKDHNFKFVKAFVNEVWK